MTSVLTEDWSGYAENTQVQTITDWGVYGSFASIQAAPRVNASSQIKVDADVGGVCYYSAGSPSHYMEAVVAVQFSGAFIDLGPAVGVSARLNWFSVQARSATTTVITYRNGGGTQLLTSYTSTPVVIGDLVRLELNDDNETIELFINGVSAGTPVSITGLYTPTNFVGFIAFSINDPLIGAIELGTLSSDTVTVDGFYDGEIKSIQGATETIPISGTYTSATTPTTIEVSVVDNVTKATVLVWALLDASPSAGTYSGTIDLPKGPYYQVLTRFSNATTIQGSSGRLGVGYILEASGQSNTVELFSGTSYTLDPNSAVYDGITGKFSSAATGVIALALNDIATDNGCVVGIFNTSVSATTISQYLPPSGTYYADRVAKLTAVGGKLNGFYWGQGESNIGTPQATYEANLATLYTDLLTRSGQTSATLPMSIVQLGRNAGGTGSEAGWQAVRNAQTAFANATTDAHISHQTMDLPMGDGLHRWSAGAPQEALRFADSFGFAYGTLANSGRGPIPTSAGISGSSVVVTHNLNGSTALTIPATANTQYELSNDDFVTPVQPTSVSAGTADQIILNFASLPTGTLKLRSHQGQDFDVSTFPTGDLTYDTQGVMVEPITIELSVSGAVGNTPPVANAGADQIDIAASAPVTLNGTASSDADGTIASYAWTQTAGDTVTLSSASVVSPTFTAPTTIANQTLTFSLVVTDDGGAASTPDTVDISVLAEVAISFTGVVGSRAIAVGGSLSISVAGNFTGVGTPFTYSLQSGTLPTGLTLNTSTGVISGTPTVISTQSGISVRATDTAANTVDTNLFTIDITDGVSIPVWRRSTYGSIARELRTNGFSGTVNGVTSDWLLSEGFSGNFNEALDRYLGSLGKTGNLQDKIASWRDE